MRVVRFHEFGGSDKLQLEHVPRPHPQAGELLVSIRSIGVNPVDWKIRAGKTRYVPSLPVTSGQDFAGVVEEPAAARSDLGVGARVFGFAQGSYAEYALARAGDIAALPEAVGFETAAALPTPGLTAMQMLQAAEVRSGQTVLIHGAGGSVGSLATQLAVHAGARVFATALGADVGYVGELGAERVIDNDHQRFEDVVGEVDVVIDLVGGETQRRSYAVVSRKGVLVTSVGLVDSAAAGRRGFRAIAFVMSRNRQDLERLIQMVVHNQLRVRIARVLPFPEARQAQELTEHGEVNGKVLLRVA
jgi:NADPH:quinone reductase-like Zn-dependent oxidoreductase